MPATPRRLWAVRPPRFGLAEPVWLVVWDGPGGDELLERATQLDYEVAGPFIPDPAPAPVCHHESPVNYDRTRWKVCTRPKGHADLHEAGDYVWSDDTMPYRRVGGRPTPLPRADELEAAERQRFGDAYPPGVEPGTLQDGEERLARVADTLSAVGDEIAAEAPDPDRVARHDQWTAMDVAGQLREAREADPPDWERIAGELFSSVAFLRSCLRSGETHGADDETMVVKPVADYRRAVAR